MNYFFVLLKKCFIIDYNK